MSGETELHILLRSLNPTVHDHRFVFTHIPKGHSVDWSKIQPLGMFQEREGTTLILEQHIAQAHALHYETIFACITLQIHSSLNAVGLTAAISHALATENIPANVIAAYHHDHIFVPEIKTVRAIEILKDLSNRS
ncbi:MAG: hypothetical protein CL916_14920 [Deltaproteobacteria bacterium]|nr:hypothetical protein [Deltaproteobacteria bacterium]